jgi:transposase-like protein
MKQPQTLKEAIEYFSDPANCFEYVINLRWQNGTIVCPHCQSQAVSLVATRRVWNCLACRKQFSLKVGTIFEDSAIGLDK